MITRKPKRPAPVKLDRVDLRILALLQEDASLSLQKVAERVNLSATPCWRRIQRLRKLGVIRREVAILDAAAVNLPVTVFVTVRTNQHTAEWLDRFARGVTALPEVLEFYRMSGDVDYLLRIVVPDISGYDAFYKRLIKVAEIHDVSSSFAMEEIKFSTALPLPHV